MFLSLGNDSLVDAYLKLEPEQRAYLEPVDNLAWSVRYLPLPLRAVKLEVKSGKVMSLSLAEYLLRGVGAAVVDTERWFSETLSVLAQRSAATAVSR